jgi:hypothetical protein
MLAYLARKGNLHLGYAIKPMFPHFGRLTIVAHTTAPFSGGL